MIEVQGTLVEPFVSLIAGACLGIVAVDASRRLKRVWIAVTRRDR